MVPSEWQMLQSLPRPELAASYRLFARAAAVISDALLDASQTHSHHMHHDAAGSLGVSKIIDLTLHFHTVLHDSNCQRLIVDLT